MARHAYLIFFLLSLALCTSLQASAAQLNQTQAQILGNLSAILESDFSVPRSRLNNAIDSNPCNWTGATCVSHASSEVVSQLCFSNLGISSSNSSPLATFFALICSLDTLQYLDLSSNRLISLPDSFFSNCTGLSGLKYLNLSNNGLDMILSFASGTIASFSLAYLITKCLKKPEVTDGERGLTDKTTSPSVVTPSLDRYLGMVQRWQYLARLQAAQSSSDSF